MTLLEAPQHFWKCLQNARLNLWCDVDLFLRPLYVQVDKPTEEENDSFFNTVGKEVQRKPGPNGALHTFLLPSIAVLSRGLRGLVLRQAAGL